MNIEGRADDENEWRRNKEDENRSENQTAHLWSMWDALCSRVCFKIICRCFGFSDNDPPQSALLKPSIYPPPTTVCTQQTQNMANTVNTHNTGMRQMNPDNCHICTALNSKNWTHSKENYGPSYCFFNICYFCQFSLLKYFPILCDSLKLA